MKKRIVCILVTLGVAGFFSLFFLARITNNFKLNKFAKQLYDMELPGNLVIVEKNEICGKLNGNGNSMDFLACLLIKSDRNKAELESLLDNVNFKCIGNDEKICVNKEVVKVDGEILQSKYLQHETIKFESLAGETNFSDYYAMVIYDGGYSSNFDIRGH